MESIGTNDASFGNNLSISRMYLATTYLHAHFLEALIQELEQVCILKINHMHTISRVLVDET